MNQRHSNRVIESGNYEDFKRCALAFVKLPVLGCDYRLLNDDFEKVWRLTEVRHTAFNATMYAFHVVLTDVRVHKPWDMRCNVYCSLADCMWECRVAAGEIVVNGEDLPEGRIKQWAISKGIAYVVSREMHSLEQFMALSLTRSEFKKAIHEDETYTKTDKSGKSKFLQYVQALEKRSAGQKDHRLFAQSRGR